LRSSYSVFRLAGHRSGRSSDPRKPLGPKPCGSAWPHLGSRLGSAWHHLGLRLGSAWHHLGLRLGSADFTSACASDPPDLTPACASDQSNLTSAFTSDRSDLTPACASDRSGFTSTCVSVPPWPRVSLRFRPAGVPLACASVQPGLALAYASVRPWPRVSLRLRSALASPELAPRIGHSQPPDPKAWSCPTDPKPKPLINRWRKDLHPHRRAVRGPRPSVCRFGSLHPKASKILGAQRSLPP
jgi:hypothetical protein